jgi:large subunit ribosomal protein L25
MEFIEIEVTPRDGVGSAASRRLRAGGQIPSVVYSEGKSAEQISLDENDFVNMARTSRRSQLFKFKSKEAKLNGISAVVKEVQRNYIKNSVIHVDFHSIDENQPINVLVPLSLNGEAPGVKLDGGILTIVTHELLVRCLPRDIPEIIEVDVSELRLGQSIHADKLKLPEKVTVVGNPGQTIVSVVAVRVVVEEVAPTAGGATAGGATAGDVAAGDVAAGGAAAATPGATPAAGGAKAAAASGAAPAAPTKDAKK